MRLSNRRTLPIAFSFTLMGGGILSLIFLLISTILILSYNTHPTNASSSTDTDISVSIDSAIALSLTNCDSSNSSTIKITVEPTPNGTFKSNCQIVTVNTNSPGYNLLTKSSSSTLNYLNPTTISPTPTIPSTINTTTTPSTLTNNTWGFAVQDRLNFTGQTYEADNANNTYSALPTTDTTIYQTNTFPLPETDHAFYYGTKLDTDALAGTYSTTITYTAIGNEPAPILDSITINGSYRQDGTPTPDNPVEVEVVEDGVVLNVNGSNLINPNEMALRNGATYGTVNPDGSVTGDGRASDPAGWSYANTHTRLTLPAGTYTFSYTVSEMSLHTQGAAIYIEDNTLLASLWAGSSAEGYTNTDTYRFATFTLDQTTNIGIMAKMYSATWWFQLEAGPTATDFMSYTSSSTNTISLQDSELITVDQSNLANWSLHQGQHASSTLAQDSDYIKITPGTPTYNARWFGAGLSGNNVQMTTGKTYKLSFDAYVDGEEVYLNYVYLWRNPTGTNYPIAYGGNNSMSNVLTNTVQHYEIEFTMPAYDGDATFYPMVAVRFGDGTSNAGKTESALYVKNLSLVENHWLGALPNGTADTIDVDMKGNVVLTKRVGKVIYDGSSDEIWSRYQASSVDRYTTATPLVVADASTSNDATNSAVSSHFRLSYEGTLMTERFYIANLNTNPLQINFASAGTTTLDDWKAWLSANPTTFYYQFIEPYTVDLGKISMPHRASIVNAWTVSDPATNTTLNYI